MSEHANTLLKIILGFISFKDI